MSRSGYTDEDEDGIDPATLDLLGQLVRHVWMQWAKEQPSPKASWLVPWEELPESDREVDRHIGAALFDLGLESAATVCNQRAQCERIYSGMTPEGDRLAVPHLRCAEDIEAFRHDPRLQETGGPYPGTGLVNPLHRIRNMLKVQP
jgi:hypothetical protein